MNGVKASNVACHGRRRGGVVLTIALAFGCGAAPLASAARAADASGAYRWKNVAIVGGGFVDGIEPDPAEKGLMYARTDVGGAYRWDARGSHWVALTDGFGRDDWNLTGIESIAVDPTDAHRVYAAVGTYTNSWAGNGAILRSDDQGRTWQTTPMPFKLGGNEDGRFAGERLVVDPAAPNVLYLGTRHVGLWRSADRGATWSRVDSFPATGDHGGVGVVFVTFQPHTNRMFVGVSDRGAGLYRSDDNGATFQPVAGQPTGLLVNHGQFSADGHTLFLTYGDHPGPNGMTDGAVWRWDASGGNWTSITPQTPGANGAPRFGYGGLAVDARHPETLMATTMDRWSGGDTIFRSTDGGAHWTDLGPKTVRDWSLSPWLTWGHPRADLGHWMGALAIDPFDSDHVLYGTGATIWASDDVTRADRGQPTHWSVGAAGLEETVVTGLVSPPSGAPLLSSVDDIDGFRHVDLDTSPSTGFFLPAHGSNTGIDCGGADPSIVARVFNGGARGAYSTDNARAWTDFAAAPPAHGDGKIAVSADGHVFVWTVERAGAFVSRDRGASWQSCAGLPSDVTVVSDRKDPARFYGYDRAGGAVYASADGGATFARAAVGLPKNGGDLRAVPGSAGELYLAAGDGVYHSTDFGASFVRTAGAQAGYRIGFGKAAPGKTAAALYLAGRVGGTDGIYRSDDGGATWVRIDDDRHRFATISAITGDPRVYGRVYIGTGGRGILYGDPANTERTADNRQ